MPVCAVCGQENPEIAKFCLACGAALTSEPPREERKVVSVLFADLVGFTSRAERLDPEDVRALLAPYWARLRTELERYGGTVEKFIGDAVMALFGAPVAHEDDPERAVRAALAIRDWVREEEELQVRIAVTTGEALVMLGARASEGEGMAAGDVVNTAARLQAAAPVNGILVGASTYRATRDSIEYVEREPVRAKGKAGPIAVWEVLEARSRFGSDVEQRTLLPLVGRGRELATLLGALERSRREREPQLVTLVGVPGIGKSRLVAELFASLSGPELVFWRQGRALPYGEGVSFWAFAEMVKAQAGIRENDAAPDVERKLRASVEAVVAEDEREWVLEHLLPLVGVETTARYGESYPAWRRYVEGLAEQRPLVLVFEDLHWADEGLLDFVDHLVEWATGVPLLVVATARPELLDRRPGWGGGKLNAATLALTPLADDEAAQIIQGVLERAVLPAATQQALLERAGGNPLYAEQFARLYLERGSADDLPLPETIQGIVAARLDGLTADEKRLVQDAAVLGKVFWAGAAAALCGLDGDALAVSLHALERRGLIRRERRSAVAGDTEYAFRHVLIREVAYGQIPRSARAERHLSAADWIESLGRSDDHAELLAHHLGSALELRPDDAALADRTRTSLRRAAERALALHAYASALRLCTDALALWPDDDPGRAHLLAGEARARYRVDGDRSGLDAAIDALERTGDVEAAAETAAFAANAAWNANRRPEAEALIARGEALLSGRDPSPALAAVLAERARLITFVEPSDVAEPVAREALELAEQLELPELRASALATLATIALTRGDYVLSGELEERAIAVAPPGSPERLRATANRALAALVDGDGAETLAWIDRALEAATRAGDISMFVWLYPGVVTERYYKLGRWDEGLAQVERGLAEMERSGSTYMQPNLHLLRAAMLGARGDDAGAWLGVETALAALDSNRDVQYRAGILFYSAPTVLLLGDLERSRALLEQLAAVDTRNSDEGFAPPYTADQAVTISRAGMSDFFLERMARKKEHRRLTAARLVWTGRAAEAAELYARAAPQEEALARLHAAEQLASTGRVADAAVELERGLAFYRAVGATRVVRDAEQLLAAAS